MSAVAMISYNTSLRQTAPNAYRVAIVDSDEAVTGRLDRTGPVQNGVVSYRGVFRDEATAAAAVAAYVGRCKIVRYDNITDVSHAVLRTNQPVPRLPEFCRVRILASRTVAGTFTAA